MTEVPDSKDNKSVERTLAILEIFAQRRTALTLRELAQSCDIPVSTCHSIVHTLLNRTYLYQANRRKGLYPTRRILDIAAAIVEHDPYLERLGPTLEQLRADTRETVILGKRQGDQILYLEVLESPQTIRYSSQAGALKPLHSTCIGKVMLGALSPTERTQWLQIHALSRVTANTITTQPRFLDSLNEGTRLGYFTTRGENVADVTAIAVPIRINNELLGMAVAGPSHRMDPNFQRHIEWLLQAQSRLRREGIAT